MAAKQSSEPVGLVQLRGRCAPKTWKMWMLKDMQDITKNSKSRACILSQILPVLMHQTKTLVLPSCITD
ncbi:unnamed protein product [Rangifer tarandus platyrhynchus]|uniref:Uncharacterized protein n=1 Tax=Rangifer tarandus platyrhynchus TaxID=3082113 RepID=A0ABN8ZCL7_RANTA|nr:unnamed protein product [Rangifer tarandus platyrhynchus]